MMKVSVSFHIRSDVPETTISHITGFEFKFEANTPANERKYYYRAYKDIVDKLSDFQHCMCCDKFVCINRIQMHPLLHVTVCAECYRIYKSIDFKSSGSALCRWCGRGKRIL